MDEQKRRLIEKLRNKEYRDDFVIEIIDTGVPFQIYALREQRKWSQKELGTYTGMAQETISRLEDPNYAKLTLKTLKRLASAFDVALMVRFVPFSELVELELNLTGGSLEVLSFEKEPYFREKRDEELDGILVARYFYEHNKVTWVNELTAKPTKPISQALEFEQKKIETPLGHLISGVR
jgi:transcriptional regulator with XRE-family HTH domain